MNSVRVLETNKYLSEKWEELLKLNKITLLIYSYGFYCYFFLNVDNFINVSLSSLGQSEIWNLVFSVRVVFLDDVKINGMWKWKVCNRLFTFLLPCFVKRNNYVKLQ